MHLNIKKGLSLRYLFKFICFSLAMILLTSCSNEPQPLLKVGANQWPGYEPMFLARKIGLYDQHKIKLVELPSATESIHLLQIGALDAAALTLDETLLAVQHNTALSIILIFDISDGADVLLAKPNIKNLHDLKGKRIGVESSAVGATMLFSALKHAKLKESDIKIVYLTADEHVSAYKEGLVDAVMTFEPAATALSKQGAHVLFNSHMIPNHIIDVLAVRTEQLERQGANIQLLVDGYYKAREFMRKQPEQAIHLIAPRLNLTPAETVNAFHGLKLPSLTENKALFSGNPSIFDKSSINVLSMLKQAGLIQKSNIDVSQLQNSHFIKASRL